MTTDLAWLAGLWDGEGSVGVTVSRTPRPTANNLSRIRMEVSAA